MEIDLDAMQWAARGSRTNELVDEIETVEAEYTSMIDEIARLSAELNPGVSASHAQKCVKDASTRLERAQKRINKTQQAFTHELETEMSKEAWSSKIQPDGSAAHQALLEMISCHLERQGLATAAFEMLQEDKELPRLDLTASSELQSLLQCLRSDESELELLNKWVEDNREDLLERSSLLPRYMAELRFFQVLSTQGDAEALNVLRDEYATSSLCLDTLERLAGLIPLRGTASWEGSSKYIESIRQEMTSALIDNFWALKQHSNSEDHLTKTLEASIVAFPVLERLSKAMALTPWSSESELPAEVSLPPRLQFHPIFVCPVLKEQTGDSSPKLLPCRHMLSTAAYAKLVESEDHFITCPYCSKECRDDEVTSVQFVQGK